jgi:hypothetical protein
MSLAVEQRLAAIVNGRDYALRLKPWAYPEPEDRGLGLGIPVPGYLEINGPWRDIEWLEVNPVATTHLGRQLSRRVEDHTAELTPQLAAAGLRYELVNGLVRVSLTDLHG